MMPSSTFHHDHEWSPGANGVLQGLNKLVLTVTSRTEQAREAFDSNDFKKAHVIAKVHSLKTRTTFNRLRTASDEALHVGEYRWKKELGNASSDQSIIDAESSKPTGGMTPKALKDHREHIQLHIRSRDREQALAGILHQMWSYEVMELEKKLVDTHFLIKKLEELEENAKNAREGKVKNVKKHEH